MTIERPTVKQLKKIWLRTSLSAEEVAEMLGCSRRTLFTWLNEYGISRDEERCGIVPFCDKCGQRIDGRGRR